MRQVRHTYKKEREQRCETNVGAYLSRWRNVVIDSVHIKPSSKLPSTSHYHFSVGLEKKRPVQPNVCAFVEISNWPTWPRCIIPCPHRGDFPGWRRRSQTNRGPTWWCQRELAWTMSWWMHRWVLLKVERQPSQTNRGPTWWCQRELIGMDNELMNA